MKSARSSFRLRAIALRRPRLQLLSSEFELGTELHGQVVLGAVVPVDEVADVDAQPNRADVEFTADAGIHGTVGRRIAESADGIRKAVSVASVGHAKTDEAALDGSEEPRM